MPAIYAHYKMGKETIPMLDGEQTDIINEYRELFDIGVHGPDIFFYYKPLLSNPIKTMGNDIHKENFKKFLDNAIKVINRKKNKKPYLAYLYGFLCHFSLDTCTHGLVNKYMDSTGLSHIKVEGEYDRSLMCEDGKNPLTYVLTVHINPSPYNSKIIYEFYKDIFDVEGHVFEAIDVYKALKSMIWYNKVLRAPHPFKRNALRIGMKYIGIYHYFGGFIMGERPHPKCIENNKCMRLVMEEAKELAKSFIEGLDGYMKSNIDLPSEINQDFNGVVQNGKA